MQKIRNILKKRKHIFLIKNILNVLEYIKLKKEQFWFSNQFKKKRKYISDNGSDKWVIENIFQKKKYGYFIECGAYTGAKKSNTFILEKFYKWNGVCIEPNPYYFKKLKIVRNCHCLNECISGEEKIVDFLCYKTTGGIISDYTDNNLLKINSLKKNSETYEIIKMKTKKLDQILDECRAPKIIEFLSLDVEGSETDIMINFPFNKYIFLTMVIERPSDELNNYFIRNDYKIVKVKPKGDTFYIHRSINDKIN